MLRSCSQLVLDRPEKKVGGQLLGRRNRLDFWVPGRKGKHKEEEEEFFCLKKYY